jgi:hypothetical protein
MENNENLERRIYGIHFTSVRIFNDYIMPQIRDILYFLSSNLFLKKKGIYFLKSISNALISRENLLKKP